MSRSNKIKGSKIFGTSSLTQFGRHDRHMAMRQSLKKKNCIALTSSFKMCRRKWRCSSGHGPWKAQDPVDELSTIGEEFVEFLEDVVEKPQEEVATVEEMPFNSCQKKMRRERKYSASTRERSSSANQKMPNSKPFKATAGSANKGETIDDMLDQLKRDMGISSH